jgi:hypothetical protein
MTTFWSIMWITFIAAIFWDFGGGFYCGLTECIMPEGSR